MHATAGQILFFSLFHNFAIFTPNLLFKALLEVGTGLRDELQRRRPRSKYSSITPVVF